MACSCSPSSALKKADPSYNIVWADEFNGTSVDMSNWNYNIGGEGWGNFSFPSGHATSALIFYGLCAYLLWKSKIPKVWKWVSAVILFLFSLLIGFSRVYLRVHYASDVLAGFCVGSAWLILIIFILEKLKKKSDKEMA